MTDERIDDILSKEEQLVPSSGFVSAVMERVRQEAAAPSPMPFPWKRAVPGFILAAGVFGWAAVEFARSLRMESAAIPLPQLHLAPVAAQPLQQAGWVIAALAFSIGSWLLSRRLAR